MAKLILKQFSCVTETNEVGPDSPYFLIFVGGLQPRASTVKRIRGNWDDEVDAGDFWPVDQTVVDNYDLALVLCAVIEEDSDPDISEARRRNIENYMRTQFNNLTVNQATVSNFVANDLRKKFKTKIKNVLLNGDDDLIQVSRVGVGNGPGSLTLPFNGDGGQYLVNFEVQ